MKKVSKARRKRSMETFEGLPQTLAEEYIGICTPKPFVCSFCDVFVKVTLVLQRFRRHSLIGLRFQAARRISWTCSICQTLTLTSTLALAAARPYHAGSCVHLRPVDGSDSEEPVNSDSEDGASSSTGRSFYTHGASVDISN